MDKNTGTKKSTFVERTVIKKEWRDFCIALVQKAITFCLKIRAFCGIYDRCIIDRVKYFTLLSDFVPSNGKHRFLYT